MKNKPLAVVLGGTNPHIALIENLKERGYYTVLVDYFENPPAKKSADQHIRESNLDRDKVLSIAKKLNAKLVISTCLDHQNAVACYVAEKMELPAPYSYETALSVTNKVLMKRKMIENGIPTAKYIVINDENDIDLGELSFPLVVKPVDSNGSKGVRRCNNMSELINNSIHALSVSKNKSVIVEEFYVGEEISSYCIIKNKRNHVLMNSQKYNVVYKCEEVLQSFGSITPADLSSEVTKKIEHIGANIACAFEIDNSALLIQAVVSNGTINVIEFAARVSGGMIYRTAKLSIGYDIINAAVDIYLGKEMDLNYHSPDLYYSTINIYAKPSVFNTIDGYKDLIESKIIEELYFYKTKGMSIGPDMTSSDRVGAFLVKASKKVELFEKINIAIDNLEVFDIDNKRIMRRDIYALPK